MGVTPRGDSRGPREALQQQRARGGRAARATMALLHSMGKSDHCYTFYSLPLLFLWPEPPRVNSHVAFTCPRAPTRLLSLFFSRVRALILACFARGSRVSPLLPSPRCACRCVCMCACVCLLDVAFLIFFFAEKETHCQMHDFFLLFPRRFNEHHPRAREFALSNSLSVAF